MPPQRKTLAVRDSELLIQITDDGSRTLVDPCRGVAYHSGSGALAETRHVYLNNSGVAEGLAAGQASHVLEVGLGTGLGLLLTLDAAVTSGAQLNYWSLESRLLSVRILEQLELDRHLSHPELATQFLQWRSSLGDPPCGSNCRWNVGPGQAATIVVGNALEWKTPQPSWFDAVFFDPFAPEENPELWRPDYLATMHLALKAGGRLVTYCVSRQVRMALREAGFDVQRVRGPMGGKREVMVATRR